MINEVEGNKLYFAKLREDATIPTKNNEDAGRDIYACFDEDYMIIHPHETKMIPTGICSACSDDYYIQLVERGSTGTKGIAQRCGCIDSGYRGEWFVPLTNTGNQPILIIKEDFYKSMMDYNRLPVNRFYEKYGEDSDQLIFNITTAKDELNFNQIIKYPYEKAIAQSVILPVPKMDTEEISVEELQSIPSKRGIGALGSSNK